MERTIRAIRATRARRRSVGVGRLFIHFILVLREVTPIDLGAERYHPAQELFSPMKFNIRQPTPIGDEAPGLTEVSTKAPHPKEHVHQSLMDELTPQYARKEKQPETRTKKNAAPR